MYLNLMFVATILAMISWGLVVYYVDPLKSELVGVILFYLTSFFAFVGLFTLIGFNIRRRLNNNELLFVLVGVSFRQAVWLSLAITGVLMMQSARILEWWDACLLVLALGLLEAYFLSK